MEKLKIYPFRCGSISRNKSVATYMRNFDVEASAPPIMWYIEGASKKIIVDTGIHEPRGDINQPFTRDDSEHPAAHLATMGLKPEDIDIVINTHLHWDHCSNNGLFKNATFIVQKEELRFAIAPVPPHYRVYESLLAGMTPPFFEAKTYKAIKGDYDVVPGVKCLFTPGHTPGCQSVAVETSKGVYIIVGDTVPLYENIADGLLIPHGIFVNLEEYYESLYRLISMDATILPGHDEKIFEHKVYPPEGD